ncbi:MAG TPA: hypothetical protein VGJ60_06530 [Chloroflexota bacterium]|jgi:hypothetical protein
MECRSQVADGAGRRWLTDDMWRWPSGGRNGPTEELMRRWINLIYADLEVLENLTA